MDVFAVCLIGVTLLVFFLLWGLASVNGLIELVGLSFSLHCMVVVCLGDFVDVGEAGFVEGFVSLGLYWK